MTDQALPPCLDRGGASCDVSRRRFVGRLFVSRCDPAAGRSRARRIPAIEINASRSSISTARPRCAVRRAGVPRRFELTSPSRIRRHLRPARCSRWRAFPRGDRQGALVARPHRLRGRPDRHRRRRDGADARCRTAGRSPRAAGTTPKRWRRRAARSMSASSASTDRALRLRQGRPAARAASRSRCHPA